MNSKIKVNLIPFNELHINIPKEVDVSPPPKLNEDKTVNIGLEEEINFIKTENLYKPSSD